METTLELDHEVIRQALSEAFVEANTWFADEVKANFILNKKHCRLLYLLEFQLY